MTTIHSAPDDYSIKLLTTKDELSQIAPFIVEQRITLFYNYPYLYVANKEEEFIYVHWFLNLPKTAVAVAYKDSQPVAFITGTSFIDFASHFTDSIEVFEKNKLNPASYYYYAEGVVVPEHRRHGLIKICAAVLEKHALELGYKWGCFVTESHTDHPLRPADYKDLDTLWCNLGYIKSPLFITFNWQTRQLDGSTTRQDHMLHYWIKSLQV